MTHGHPSAKSFNLWGVQWSFPLFLKKLDSKNPAKELSRTNQSPREGLDSFGLGFVCAIGAQKADK